MLDVKHLKAEITAAKASWTPIAVDRPHALGNEPSSPERVQAALRAGAQFAKTRPALSFALNPPLAAEAPALLGGPAHPAVFDWRSRGVIGPVTDQGNCGSCVSFATTGLVGAQAGIELGARSLLLSQADQHFCSSHGANCGGWNNATSLGQVHARGIVTDNVFPYASAFDHPPVVDASGEWVAHCRPETFRDINTYGIDGYTAWTGDARKTYLATTGPLICGFTVYQDFDHYGGGVYRHVTGNVRGGHAVLVVGYSDVQQAWICRNSWGTGFGGPPHPDGTGGGYFMIAYGNSGIDNEPMYGCHGIVPPAGRLNHGLASFNSRLYAVWKGVHGDDSMWWSSYNGSAWAPQQRIPGVGSSVGPTVAVFNGRLYAAWKGMGTDQGIYWSSFDGHAWAAQQRIGGVATSVGPSLAVFNGRLYAAWKGMNTDQGIYWSSFDGHGWAAQQRIGGVATSVGPSLSVFNNRLYAAWKGMNNDQGIWWSSFDGHAWAPQQEIAGVATSIGPRLATFNNKLYAAWKGMGNDQGIYWSAFDGHTWVPQRRIGGVASSIGPTLGTFNNQLFAMWKGMDNDQALWFSHGDGNTWAAQANIPGWSCPD
ncbi:MAG TPA: C1 family peptidase [Solirubrobacter sp.]